MKNKYDALHGLMSMVCNEHEGCIVNIGPHGGAWHSEYGPKEDAMVQHLGDEVMDEVDEGIREAVWKLMAAGFRTTDSGDGSKFGHMEHALPFPHVFAKISPQHQMCHKAERAKNVLGTGWVVEATYSTADKTCILFCRKMEDGK